MTTDPPRAIAPTVLALAAAVLVAAAAVTWAAVGGRGGSDTLQDRVRSVASTLRCPVCQNLSVADSSSDLAREMRASIARDLQAGRSQAEIREAFVEAYGEWVLLAPRPSGAGLFAWAIPFVLLAGGLTGAVVAVHRWMVRARSARSAGEEPLSSADRRLLENELSRAGEEPE